MFNFWPFNIARLRRERAARAAMRTYFQSQDIPVLFEGTAEEYLAWLDQQPPKASKAVPRQSDLGLPHHPGDFEAFARQHDAAERANAMLESMGLPKPTRPAPPMPRVKPRVKPPRSAQWHDDNSTALRGPSD